ncbi:MAG TPA: 3-oxoacyl-ACP synthase, partial [Myxococcota bacterium]|nr:3-oxoacyl-ACP synthase [Myxococcota bacterium]
MAMRSRVAGTGMCVPDRVVTNADMSQWMETSDEWIQQRTGIRERRWVDDGQRPSDLARGATLAALEQAELEVADIDCILLATLSSEHEFPGTAFFLHESIDAGDIPCIDLRAQCSGFLYALQMGDALV